MRIIVIIGAAFMGAGLAASGVIATTGSATGDVALGQAVFQASCTTCHTVARPGRTAPPMSYVARTYLDVFTDTDHAVQRIEEWLIEPVAAATALPSHVLDEYGLMPDVRLTPARRRAVARYVLTLASPARAYGT